MNLLVAKSLTCFSIDKWSVRCVYDRVTFLVSYDIIIFVKDLDNAYIQIVLKHVNKMEGNIYWEKTLKTFKEMQMTFIIAKFICAFCIVLICAMYYFVLCILLILLIVVLWLLDIWLSNFATLCALWQDMWMYY